TAIGGSPPVIFTDLRFLALFAGCALTFVAAPRARRSEVIVEWGAIFYGVYAGVYAALVIALVIATAFSDRKRTAWVVGLTVCGLLAFFKISGPGDVISAANA